LIEVDGYDPFREVLKAVDKGIDGKRDVDSDSRKSGHRTTADAKNPSRDR